MEYSGRVYSPSRLANPHWGRRPAVWGSHQAWVSLVRADSTPENEAFAPGLGAPAHSWAETKFASASLSRGLVLLPMLRLNLPPLLPIPYPCSSPVALPQSVLGVQAA